jgi:hypothetical protein
VPTPPNKNKPFGTLPCANTSGGGSNKDSVGGEVDADSDFISEEAEGEGGKRKLRRFNANRLARTYAASNAVAASFCAPESEIKRPDETAASKALNTGFVVTLLDVPMLVVNDATRTLLRIGSFRLEVRIFKKADVRRKKGIVTKYYYSTIRYQDWRDFVCSKLIEPTTLI